VKRIAVILPNWLGDAVMCTPAIRALHRRFPIAEVTVVGKQALCELVEGLSYVHRTIPIPGTAHFRELWDVARRIRPWAEDLVVIFPHSFRAALLGFLSRARRRLAYSRNGRRMLLTDAVPPNRVRGKIVPEYMTTEYLKLVAALGCEDDHVGLELRADEESLAMLAPKLEGDGPLVGIAPGAAFGPSKQWLVDRFAAVADRLREEFGARCVLMTGPGEDEVRESITRLSRHGLIRYDDGKPSVRLMKALVSQLDLMISNDSGPRHVAVAFGVPVICIMGPTAPVYSEGPYEKGERIRVEVDCGPCQKPVCTTDHRCMTRISVDRVVRAAAKYLCSGHE